MMPERQIRLLVIPFVIYSIWMIVTGLFEGDCRLFLNADSRGIIVYTVFSCIITGMILPVYCVRESFVTGAVNMSKIGIHLYFVRNFRTVKLPA